MKLRGPIVSTLFVCSALLIFAAGARAAEEGSANSAAGATGIFKWINFAIVAGALIWVFIKVLPPTFRSNADKISSAISKAQATKADADRKLRDAEQRLAHLEEEVRGLREQAQTDAAGEYRINNLPVGTYDVTASKMGFLTHTEQGVGLELNHNSTVNFTLQVSATATTVEVTAAPVSIDTTTAQIQSTFNEEQIVNLPIIENSTAAFGALEVSMLSAGVASNGGVGQGIGPSVGGPVFQAATAPQPRGSSAPQFDFKP